MESIGFCAVLSICYVRLFVITQYFAKIVTIYITNIDEKKLFLLIEQVIGILLIPNLLKNYAITLGKPLKFMSIF